MNDLIEKYSHNAGEKSFLKHIKYFNENDAITTDSIKNKWHELTGENKWITWIKGYFIISGANRNLPSGCPYKHEFQNDEIMQCLKHPCDTGIVKKDGNINVNVLYNMMLNNFDYSLKYSCFYLTKSKMMKYLKECEDRDKQIDNGTGIIYVSWNSVAETEWTIFFDTFCDFTINGDKSISADTFLQFYFDCDKLYQRILSK